MVGENHESGYPFLIVYFGMFLNKTRNAYLILLHVRIRMRHYAMCSFSLCMNETQEKCDTFVFYG